MGHQGELSDYSISLPGLQPQELKSVLSKPSHLHQFGPLPFPNVYHSPFFSERAGTPNNFLNRLVVMINESLEGGGIEPWTSG